MSSPESLKREFTYEKFTVRLFCSKQETFVTLSYCKTRLQNMEHPTLESAEEDYRTVCDTVRDVLMCKAQENNSR